MLPGRHPSSLLARVGVRGWHDVRHPGHLSGWGGGTGAGAETGAPPVLVQPEGPSVRGPPLQHTPHTPHQPSTAEQDCVSLVL